MGPEEEREFNPLFFYVNLLQLDLRGRIKLIIYDYNRYIL